MIERDLQDWVAAAARLLGWKAYHARAAMTRSGWRTAGSYDSKGFPDLVLVRERVLWVEIKVGSRRLTPEQSEWLNDLRDAGQETYVWREADWLDGSIEAVLRRDTRSAVA